MPQQDIFTTIPGLPDFIECFPPFPFDYRYTWYSKLMTITEVVELMESLHLDLTTIPGPYPVLIRDTVYYTTGTKETSQEGPQGP